MRIDFGQIGRGELFYCYTCVEKETRQLSGADRRSDNLPRQPPNGVKAPSRSNDFYDKVIMRRFDRKLVAAIAWPSAALAFVGVYDSAA